MLTRREAVRAVAGAAASGDGVRLGVHDGDWEEVLDVAAGHGLLPALWPAVADAAPTARGVARAPFAIIEDAYRVNRARVADLAAQGHDLLGALAAAGVEAVPLKGWHGLLVGRWPDPAMRVMVDLDVLVAPDAIARASAVLDDLGYVDLGVDDPEGLAGHEVPARGHPGRTGSVELHRSVLVPRRAAVLPADDVRAAAVPVAGAPVAVRVPSPTHAMVLLIAHAQLQDDGARLLRLPLRALVEAAVIHGGAEGPAIDWAEVHDRFHRTGSGMALAGFAVACEELTGVALPVPRRGGHAWWQATAGLLDRPRAAAGWREVASLPRALSAERMRRRYGVEGWGAVQRARAGHVARGVVRRVRGG